MENAFLYQTEREEIAKEEKREIIVEDKSAHYWKNTFIPNYWDKNTRRRKNSIADRANYRCPREHHSCLRSRARGRPEGTREGRKQGVSAFAAINYNVLKGRLN